MEINMKDVSKPLNCHDEDVLAFGDDTFKIGKLRKAVNESSNRSVAEKFINELKSKGLNINPDKMHPDGCYATYDNCLKEGIDCEVLNLGSKGWKKGKLRFKISVEFYLEEEDLEITEPESPLDDIRRKINEVST
jgi:hypothetical protein